MLFFAFAAAGVGCAFQLGYLPVRSFDSEEWRNLKTAANQVRVQMIESLTRSGKLDGVSRSEVIELLGPPDGGAYFEDWDLFY